MTDIQRILLVEDDPRLSGLICEYLTRQGFHVTVEARGDTGAQRILGDPPDLVVLDLMLPGMDGLEVCRRVRARYPGPILMLTAREDDMDQVAGLEMGADDYVKKPVEPRVLLARIRALARRVTAPPSSGPPEPQDAARIVIGALTVDRTTFEVQLDGRPVDLTTTEFELLWLLAHNAGTVLDRNTIMGAIRGIDYDGIDRWVDVGVSRLRRKLLDDADSPRRIKTVWGKGYLLARDAW